MLIFDRSLRAIIYLDATLWDLQALKKAVENLKVLIFPLILTTLFKTAICYSVYLRCKYVKGFFVIQYFNIALNKVGFIGAINFS